MGKVIAIANQKGGVGKTTTSLNLTTALNKKGFRVLLIDTDPQSSLTIAIGLEPQEVTKSLYNVLVHNLDIRKTILKDEENLLHFIPSSPDLATAEQELVALIGREEKFKDALNPVINDYDFIILDCPPSIGLIMINDLVASDYIIAPMVTEYLALRGFNLIEKTIEKIKKLNNHIKLMGILITRYEGNTRHHKEIYDEIKKNYPMFETFIKKSVKFPDAVAAGLPIQDYDPKSDAAKSYDLLAEEVLEWLKECQ